MPRRSSRIGEWQGGWKDQPKRKSQDDTETWETDVAAGSEEIEERKRPQVNLEHQAVARSLRPLNPRSGRVGDDPDESENPFPVAAEVELPLENVEILNEAEQ